MPRVTDKQAARLVPAKPKKLTKFQKAISSNITRALSLVGAIVEGDWVIKVSGEGFTRNPARSSEFIGVLSGAYMQSVTYRVHRLGKYVVIGPNVKSEEGVNYAAVHEFGGGNVPARPIRPAIWKDVGKECRLVFRKVMTRPLR